jgi:catechol 2,3-dioxygenase-like lactoylglutathione lyase family enzyme
MALYEEHAMIRAFNHTSFTVTDMDRALRFWTEGLGFQAASVSPRAGNWQEAVTGVPGAELLVAHLYGHGTHIEFIQYLSGAGASGPIEPNRETAAHVCFEVDNIETIWQGLMALGASSQGRIAAVASGPMNGLRAGYLRDPGGIVIELVEIPQPTP